MEYERSPVKNPGARAFLWANALLLRGCDADMRTDGLSLEWFDVLIHLYEAPDGELPLRTLTESVVLSRSGLTRLLDRMERAELIERSLSTSDRRRFDVKLTGEGRRVFERVLPGHQRALQTRFLDHFTKRDLERLEATLSKVIAANQPETR